MRALGVDYGEKRIGLALSDASGTLARPWKSIERTGNPLQVARAIIAELQGLEREEQAAGVVVIGHPLRLSGEPSGQTGTVLQVAEHLRELAGLPVVLQDERLTSLEAEALLARREKDWRKRKGQLDAMAAAVILQDYLDGAGRRGAAGEDSGT